MKFHATADTELVEIRKVFPASDVIVIPNILLEIDDVKVERQEKNTDVTNIIFLSRVDPKKGIELLLKALSEIQWGYHLTIVGSGSVEYLNSLQQCATSLGITENVTWAGPIYGHEKYELLSNSDLMALTSYNENFGNIVLEALVCGTPVLLSDKVGLSTYVEKKQLGWICSTECSVITDTLNQFHKEIEKQKKIREIAPQSIKTDFGADTLLKSYLNMYNN